MKKERGEVSMKSRLNILLNHLSYLSCVEWQESSLWASHRKIQAFLAEERQNKSDGWHTDRKYNDPPYFFDSNLTHVFYLSHSRANKTRSLCRSQVNSLWSARTLCPVWTANWSARPFATRSIRPLARELYKVVDFRRFRRAPTSTKLVAR